jgi:hypothetical protein
MAFEEKAVRKVIEVLHDGERGFQSLTLLDTAEQGEDVAKKAYEEALKVSGIPSSITNILRKQQPHIQQSHDKVKALRDATAA